MTTLAKEKKETMDKLDPKKDGASPDVVAENLERLRELFPEVFAEGKVDFGALRETLGEYVEEKQERYSFTWHGKGRARRIAQTPSTGTLLPCPEESVEWDKTQNLFIEGDNLEVLKLLQKSYHRRVKMIYIDPPYNTGKEFIYPDKYQDNLATYLRYTGQVDDAGYKFSANTESSGRYHTNWLNMMYPRLKLARSLLMDDGLIFISIDDNEAANLRHLCNEIFGEENFVDCIIWKKRYGGGAKEKHLVTLHEYVFIYARSKDQIPPIFVPLSEDSIKRYYTNRDEHFDARGPFRTHPLEAMKSFDDRANLRFTVTAPDGATVAPKRQWRWSKERMDEALAVGEVHFLKGKDGEWTLHSKQYLKDENGAVRETKAFSLIDDVFSQHGTNEVVDLFGDAKVFDFPKPSGFLKKLLMIGTTAESNDICLDFFAGSAATGHAVIDLNSEDGGDRRFILVQLPEPCGPDTSAGKKGYNNIAQIGQARLRIIATRFKEREQQELPGLQRATAQDVGFRVLRLSSSNIKAWDADFDALDHALFNAVENVKPERSEDDVLYELLLKYGLDLAIPIEARTVKGKKVYILGAGALVVCLATGVTLEVVEGIAALKDELKPEVMRVVFRDAGFADDVVKTNTVQILKQAGIDDVKSL